MMHLKISHTFGFRGSEAINLPQHRKEGWTRHIHAGPSRIIVLSLIDDTLTLKISTNR
jgi:hypothetical protein